MPTSVHTQPASHRSTPSASSSASQASVKAHRALTLFDALRASVRDSTLQIPHVDTIAAPTADSAGNATAASSSSPVSHAGQPIAAAEAALMHCTPAELRHRLLITEAANKTLCVKNAQLVRQVRQLEEAVRRTATTAAAESAARQEEQLSAAASSNSKSSVREQELTEALRSLTARMASEQAARQAADGDRVALQQRVQSLELHKEQLAARLSAALQRTASTQQEAATSRTSQAQLKSKTAQGGDATAKAELDRMLDAQQRLAQLQQQYNALLDVQLAAVLGEAVQGTSSSASRVDCSCVNAEVKKLFAAMRERLRTQERQQERERARMNATLYRLEQRLATLEM